MANHYRVPGLDADASPRGTTAFDVERALRQGRWALRTAPNGRGNQPPSRSGLWALQMVPFLPLVVISVFCVLSGYRGADYPGQEFRAKLWRHAPTDTWNFRWYGGHSIVEYSVLTPPAAALLTPFALTVIVTGLSVGVASIIASRHLRPLPAMASATAFGVATSMNVLVGRTAFALGLFGLLTLVAVWTSSGQSRRWRWAIAPLVGFASPVAAVLMGVIITGALLARCGPRSPASATVATPAATRLGKRRWYFAWPDVGLGAAVAIPLFVMLAASMRSPHPAGSFPFTSKMLIACLLLLASLAAAANWSARDGRMVGTLALLGLMITAVVAVVPNPVGANFARFTSMLMLPAGVGYVLQQATRSRRRPRRVIFNRQGAASLVFVVMVATSWLHYGRVELDNAADWAADPSRNAEFFDPLLAVLDQQPTPLGRVEIPFTALHMEADVVADRFALARGWERQVDRARNQVLYSERLTAEQYRQWLDANGVGYVAVPVNRSVAIDRGGLAELALLDDADESGWLSEVWRNEDWALYRVQPGRALVEVGWTDVTFTAAAPGRIEVPATYDPRLGIEPGGCLAAGPDGNTVATVSRSGTYRIVERRWGWLTPTPGCDERR